MATKITLILDDETAKGFKSLVAGAEKAEDALEDMGDSGEDAVRRLENEIAGLKHRLRDLQKASRSSLGKPGASGAAGISAGGMIGSLAGAYLTVETLKKGYELTRDAVLKLAEDGNPALRDMADAINGTELALQDAVRRMQDANGKLTTMGELVRDIRDIPNVVLSGKVGSQLADEEAVRIRKKLLESVQQQTHALRDQHKLQGMTVEELRREARIEERILETKKGRAGGAKADERHAQRLLFINQRLFEIEKERLANAKKHRDLNGALDKKATDAFNAELKRLKESRAAQKALDDDATMLAQRRRSEQLSSLKDTGDIFVEQGKVNDAIAEQVEILRKAKKESEELEEITNKLRHQTSEIDFKKAQDSLKKTVETIDKARAKLSELRGEEAALERQMSAARVKRARDQFQADMKLKQAQQKLEEDHQKKLRQIIEGRGGKSLQQQVLGLGDRRDAEQRFLKQRLARAQQAAGGTLSAEAERAARRRALREFRTGRVIGARGPNALRQNQQLQREIRKAQIGAANATIQNAVKQGAVNKQVVSLLAKQTNALLKQDRENQQLQDEVKQLDNALNAISKNRRRRGQGGGQGR